MKKYYKHLVLLFIVFVIILVPIVIIFISNLNSSEADKVFDPTSNSSLQAGAQTEVEGRLDEVINESLQNDLDYAVVVKNFKTREEYRLNDKKEFDAASLYKLWVMGEVLRQVKDGDLGLDGIVAGDKNRYDDLLILKTPTPTVEGSSPDQVEEKEPQPISMNTEVALNKMITESDNYAALLLVDKVGYQNIDRFLKLYNFDDSSFGQPPKTTASDIAAFFEMLYIGEIVNEDYSKSMTDILKKQTLNDRIPKYLPDNTEVAHKTGELLGNKHDAGIVYSENGNYMIIVLSKTEDEAIAAEKIAKLSEAVFNYFEGVN